MLNFHAKTDTVLVTGMKRSGKSTKVMELFKKHRAGLKFAYDPDREISLRLKLPASSSLAELKNNCVQNLPVLFDPSALFPGNREEGLDFFCRWVFNVCTVLPGRKLFVCDEVQKWTNPGRGGVTQALCLLVDDGRKRCIDIIFVSQGVNEFHDKLRKQLTKIITFRHAEPLQLDWLKKRGFDEQQVARLKVPGEYLERSY